MIVFEYSKTNGAEYITHLDMLRHINKTLRRAGISVKSSNGFNPHLLIYMSSPIFCGLQSLCEYCAVETDCEADFFRENFNRFAPSGINCINAYKTEEKVNLANDIKYAKYAITGLKTVNIEQILNSAEFFVTDKRGTEREVRDRIVDLKYDGETLIALLKFGNITLRADLFCEKLKQLYGGEHITIIKTDCYTDISPERKLKLIGNR